MDVEKEDMKLAGVKEDAEDRGRWRQMIHRGDPWKEQPKGKEEEEETNKNGRQRKHLWAAGQKRHGVAQSN